MLMAGAVYTLSRHMLMPSSDSLCTLRRPPPGTMQQRCSISVEAFLWHPHSIKYSMEESRYTYNDQLLACMDNDNAGASESRDSRMMAVPESSALSIELPPRLVIHTKANHCHDLQHVAEQWASRRKYSVVAFGHVVACARSRRLWFVDFVLEKKAADNKRSYVLACIYYSQCRGGRDLEIAREYMQQVQQVCNQQMQFFPRMLALCAYDGSRASAYFCDSSSSSSIRSSRSQMLGRFDIVHQQRRWRRQKLQREPKVYAKDVTAEADG